MILAALFAPSVALAIFLDVLRPRGPTRKERDAVAASAREFRALVGMPLVCVLVLLVAPVTVAALHLAWDREQVFVTGELR